MPEAIAMRFQTAAILLIAAVSLAALLTYGFFLRSKAVAVAGTLRLRVYPRRRWQRALAVAWVCLGMALIGLFLAGESRSLFLGSLFLLLALLSCIADRASVVDIREKGVIVDGAFYAWDRLRGYRWDEGKVPALILRFDRYTSRFGVAPDQKDLIQALQQAQAPSAANSRQPQSAASPGQPPADG